uniref:Kinesin light chain n=1 Tax=Corethron hystrix TaxID=216773 RepID=A0A6U5EW42_9STRA|mmetsp:Transcript_20302/g.46060  ORF Transcript_20302/g.46060 Transcript_20302/m.46060 type:complete len:461 (+) Transcript_20302:506-1888(+)
MSMLEADNSATFVGIQKFHDADEHSVPPLNEDPTQIQKPKSVRGVYKALSLADPSDEQCAEAFKLAAEARFVDGRNEDAIELFKEAELLYGQINKSHFGRRTVLGRIGDVYLNNEDYELALEFYVKTLAMTQNVLGNDHHLVECQRAAIDSLRSQLYFDNKDQPKKILVESREDRAQAVNVQVEKVTREWRQSLGDDHPDVLTTLKSMGDIYFRGEEYDEALQNYTEFLRICRSVKNNTHPDIIPAIINIGTIHLSNGDALSAIDFYKEALRLKESIEGKKNCGTVYAHLANAHYEKGDLVEAKHLYQEALRFTKDEKGSGHPEVADLLMKIGSVNEENGNCEKAMKLYRGALGIRESYYGPNHASVAESMNSVGSVHYTRKENHMALRAYLAALRLTKEMFGDDHIQCADILVNIGNVHLQADELDEAIVTYYKALRCTLTEYGKEHEKVADVLIVITV